MNSGSIWQTVTKARRTEYLKYCFLFQCNDIIIGINLEKANSIISRSFEGETDDKIFVCDLCELHFTSLFNKQSHYSGKLHLQTLLQHLNQVVSEADEEHSPNASKSLCDNQQGPSLSLSKSLRDMAKHWDSELNM